MSLEVFKFKQDAIQLRSVLYEGSVTRHGTRCKVFPREVISGSKEVEAVVVEILPEREVEIPSLFQIAWKAIGPNSLAMTGLPCLAVLLKGIAVGWDFSAWTGITSLAGVLFLQMSVKLLNDVEDHLRLIDLSADSGSESRVLQKGWVSARQMQKVGYLCFGLAALFGLHPVLQSPETLIWIAGLAGMGVLTYSGGPLGVKYRVWGEIALFFLAGPLLAVGLSEAVFHRWDWATVSMGCAFGFAAWAKSHAANIQDLEKDLTYQIQTLAGQIGFRASRHFLLGLYIAATLSLCLVVMQSAIPFWVGAVTLVYLFWVIRLMKWLYRASGPVSALLTSVRTEASRAAVALSSLFCLALLSLIVLGI